MREPIYRFCYRSPSGTPPWSLNKAAEMRNVTPEPLRDTHLVFS